MKPPSEILIISKPIAPPWNDSNKNLAYGIVRFNCKNRFRIPGTPSFKVNADHVITEPIYKEKGKYQPSLLQNLRVLLWLLLSKRSVRVFHFFFTPNKKTSTLMKFILKIKKPPSIQTICSMPKEFKGITEILVTDKVVALSYHTQKMLETEGVKNVRVIYPGIDPRRLMPLEENPLKARYNPQNGPVVFFSGDYEFSDAHTVILNSLPEIFDQVPNLRFLFACRYKTPKGEAIEKEVKTRILNMGLVDSVLFLNEVSDMNQVLDLTDIVTLPAGSSLKKMDIPLVLLEGMALKKPIVISDVPPINEIMKGEVGYAVPHNDAKAYARAIISLAQNPDLRRKMGEAGNEVIHRYFDINKIANQYHKLYEELAPE